MNLKELSKEFNYLNELELKVGDIVVPSMGPHEGEKHEIIYDFGNGKYNIRPLGFKNKYRMGAAGAMKDQLTKVADAPMRPEPKVIDTSDIDEGTCGYGVDGKPADKPSGPHLIRKAIKEEIKKLKEGLDSKSFDMIQTIADKYSYGEILDALESFYIKNDEQNSARIANIHAKEFRRVLNMPNPFEKLK